MNNETKRVAMKDQKEGEITGVTMMVITIIRNYISQELLANYSDNNYRIIVRPFHEWK